MRPAETIQISGSIPKALADEFDRIRMQRGWSKKRAIAVAMRVFLSLPHEEQQRSYEGMTEFFLDE